MPSFKEMYKPALLSAKTLAKKTLTLTIEDIKPETIKSNSGADKESLIIEADDGAIRISLNKTNGNILAKAWGDDYAEWVGKKVKVTTQKTQFMGTPCDGILLTPIK